MWAIILVCLELTCAPLMVTDKEPTEDIQSAGIKLHRPDGSPFFVNARTIGMVREPLSSENGNAVVVFSTGGTQSTQETVQQVIDLLTAEGAR